MSRAGEELYGNFKRACDEDEFQAPARRREQVRVLGLLLFVLMVGVSALFGFG